jgi:hypothetical protein
MSNPFELLDERLKTIELLLLELRNQPNTVVLDSDQWFDLIQLQNYLPDKPAKPTVYEWVGKRLIPYHRRGKKLYFLKAEIDSWLKDGRRKTAKELSEEANEVMKHGKPRRRS